ncbi:patatin-like phospholipase family protein [Candidatus Gracilibacteria bacterium]|nr:patatin-like phospholipase family protein [Candidatus Gracilibacteria bacterium]
MNFLKSFFTREKGYGIAFGGGSARGLAHIGVIKFLEEKNIQITEIAGTSMGAVIGAFLAIEKTSDEMQKIAQEISYLQMIDFDLKNGFIKGEKIVNFLKKIFWKYRNSRSKNSPKNHRNQSGNWREKSVFEWENCGCGASEHLPSWDFSTTRNGWKIIYGWWSGFQSAIGRTFDISKNRN